MASQQQMLGNVATNKPRRSSNQSFQEPASFRVSNQSAGPHKLTGLLPNAPPSTLNFTKKPPVVNRDKSHPGNGNRRMSGLVESTPKPPQQAPESCLGGPTSGAYRPQH